MVEVIALGANTLELLDICYKLVQLVDIIIIGDYILDCARAPKC